MRALHAALPTAESAPPTHTHTTHTLHTHLNLQVPGFKFKQHGGKSELVRDCGGGVKITNFCTLDGENMETSVRVGCSTSELRCPAGETPGLNPPLDLMAR